MCRCVYHVLLAFLDFLEISTFKERGGFEPRTSQIQTYMDIFITERRRSDSNHNLPYHLANIYSLLTAKLRHDGALANIHTYIYIYTPLIHNILLTY